MTLLATVLAVGIVRTNAARLPAASKLAYLHPPVIISATRVVAPAIVMAVKPEPARPAAPPKPLDRLHRILAQIHTGLAVPVSLTQYCLQGTTRADHPVREGIVAADPKLFHLGRYVEVFLGKQYLGKYLVDDTGGNVKGATLDIWNPSCAEARRFGRQRGTAQLVVKPEH